MYAAVPGGKPYAEREGLIFIDGWLHQIAATRRKPDDIIVSDEMPKTIQPQVIRASNCILSTQRGLGVDEVRVRMLRGEGRQTLTSLIVVASPGTGVLYTMAAGLSRGARASVIAAVGCTLGIIGLGAIGGATARLAKCFGMQVLAIRRSWTPGTQGYG